MNYLLSREDMQKVFEDVSSEYETYGTVEGDGEVTFEKISDFEQISEKKSRYSPKEFLIQRNESIISLPKAEKKAVFGIKSCDLHGFYLMDKQVLGKDPFYTNKRENTLFVNFVCEKKCEGGFCSSFRGPVLKEYDIQVLREGNNYHVIASGKYDRYFTSFRKENTGEVERVMKNFDPSPGAPPLDGLEKRMTWNSSLWGKFASTCISCGACIYSCPTCYCFDIYDEGDDRKREWDSCILGGFTQTSANNIRNELSSRLRQRFYHKFVYFKKSQDEYLCTGCNRCVDDCPVGIDIKEVITHDYSSE